MFCKVTPPPQLFLEAKLKYPPSAPLPVPTFASFLKEVDSPYEVHDYVRAYLGDTPEAKDFAKQFLERRAKQNANQQKQAPQIQQQVLKQQQVSKKSICPFPNSSPDSSMYLFAVLFMPDVTFISSAHRTSESLGDRFSLFGLPAIRW